MFNYLGQTNLKTGEIMSVARIDGPNPEWRPRLMSFLDHKGAPWAEQIEMALTSALDDLGSHFYLGLLPGRADDAPVCHILVSDYHGIGLLGHVYTQPEHRQKGAIKALMDLVMKDCRARGVNIVTLGTGFDSPPFHIYRAFGFEPIVPGEGSMIREFEPVASILSKMTATVRPLRWHDWPAVSLLSVLPLAHGEVDPRSVVMGVNPRGSAEGSFIDFQLLRSRDTQVDGVALVTQGGITVGWSTVAPIDVDGVVQWTVDAYAAPTFAGHYDALLSALRLPNVPVIAYVGGDSPRADALRRAGFDFANGNRTLIRTA